MNCGDAMIFEQYKIYNRIDNLTIDTLPRTLLLLGEFGCGKHTIVEHIGNTFNLEIEDISDILTIETIDNISMRVEPKIYLIDNSKLTIRNENVILKFLEEPLKNAFIILIAESKYSIIPTVWNRCQVWEFEGYSKEYLETFIDENNKDKDIILRVANTPGKVKLYQTYPVSDMMALADKIFKNMSNANFANALTLSRFIAFKNEKDKYDFKLFLDVLLEASIQCCRDKMVKCFEAYKLTSKLNTDKYIFNIDKKALFEHYLIELKLLYTKI